MLDLFLFENEAERAVQALSQGIHHFMVDWEVTDKAERQKGFDTEIRPGTIADLRSISAVAATEVWCRINRYGPATSSEIDLALASGTTGIFLPMVTSCAEVETFVRAVDGRCRTGILVETVEACRAAPELGRIPVERVYFGLNDFAISRGGGSIFDAVLDETVARVREWFVEQEFGFGGMTSADAGDPVPARMLLQEMARLDCKYTFLRRSFRRDTRTRDPGTVVRGIQEAWDQCRRRTPQEIRTDRMKLEARLHELRA